MKTAMDLPDDALDAHERRFVSAVRQHGWFRTSVTGSDEGPAFSYTTGLWLSLGQPELIVFSLRPEAAHDLFWTVYRDGQDGHTLPVARETDAVFADLPAMTFPVARNHYREHLGWSLWFYQGGEFPCLQIISPDRSGVFPWQPSFDPTFAGLQPDLSERGWLATVKGTD